MKAFTLDNDMLTMRGHFYPTGYIVAAFPSEQAARDALKALTQAGVDEDEVSWATPDAILTALSETVTDSETPLPSAGTESDTSRRFVDLASQGHFVLLVPSPDHDHKDAVMDALMACRPSYAQKYRKLVIEDLVS